MKRATSMRIGVTMGDPDGVGPELMRASIAALRPTMPHVEWVLFGSQDAFQGTPGELHLSSGAFPERDAIEQSAEALKEGSIDAVVTAPVAKHAFQGDFPGHTELFKERLGVPRVAMMMAGPRLRVIPVTTHIALRDVTHVLTSEDIFATARLAHRTLVEQLDIATPRLALAGLNPHAGDRGLFGDEERRILQPAIEAIRAEGITIEGPSSPDTVFYQALQGRFDLVLAGYHDQALIPFKMVHFTDGVNVTLGLPRPRTSPDHGPAYDIAGQGIADPTSTRSAIEMACRLARPRAEPSASRARERSARKA